MSAVPRSPNHLLASLPAADFELFRPHLETIELVQENVLVAAGDRLTRVFFPHSGVISLVVCLAGGEMVEVAMIGRDSIFGASAALDGLISLADAVVQLSGFASTLAVGHLRTAAEQSVAFRTTLIRHEQALFAQAQQSAACNASHVVEARLARWLLRMHDLAEVVTLPLTQDFLAQMIGVKRNSVSTVAHMLQERGIIKYARGHIEIIDLAALKKASCECYGAVNAQYDRLLNKDV
jgi:CRP-like cAMP-binding protein